MKTLTTTLGLAALLVALPVSSFAAPTLGKKAAAAPTVYLCSKCHMRFSAATAKKDHYKDPMDGGTLVPVKAAASKPSHSKPSPKSPSTSTMKSMGM